MNAAVCLCHPILEDRFCGVWRIRLSFVTNAWIVIICVIAFYVRMKMWCFCCHSVASISIGFTSHYASLVLYTYYYYHHHFGSFIFFGHSEYIMLYNIAYKLHRINLCHLRHMNFTVYAHFRSAERIFLSLSLSSQLVDLNDVPFAIFALMN